MAITPDTKDWTWVLEASCPECGFDSAGLDRDELGPLVLTNAARWQVALARPDATQRPAADVWSPLEYACHVRDVHRVFARRLEVMLHEDDPLFANWDQDATAIEDDYAAQDPATVAYELGNAAESVAATYDGVADHEWGRTGRRSNGSVFTVESLGRYHLHDDIHHLWDVRG